MASCSKRKRIKVRFYYSQQCSLSWDTSDFSRVTKNLNLMAWQWCLPVGKYMKAHWDHGSYKCVVYTWDENNNNFCDVLCIVKHTNKLKCLRCGQVFFSLEDFRFDLISHSFLFVFFGTKEHRKAIIQLKEGFPWHTVHCHDFNTANSLLALLSLCIVPWECKKQEMPWMTKRKIYKGEAVYRDKTSLSHPDCSKPLQVYLPETFISHELVFLKGRFGE